VVELAGAAGIDVTDGAKSGAEGDGEASRDPFSLRGRQLEGAVLIGASLRKTDFTAADLRKADLRG
jgi:uncharacterized protein YjbI with pentapeptide repeats